jgi:hypothetical protein
MRYAPDGDRLTDRLGFPHAACHCDFYRHRDDASYRYATSRDAAAHRYADVDRHAGPAAATYRYAGAASSDRGAASSATTYTRTDATTIGGFRSPHASGCMGNNEMFVVVAAAWL